MHDLSYHLWSFCNYFIPHDNYQFKFCTSCVCERETRLKLKINMFKDIIMTSGHTTNRILIQMND